MKQYIGTKLIEADPALRYADGTIAPVNAPVRLDEPVKSGYKVRYPDGYESFSPAEVFEPPCSRPQRRASARKWSSDSSTITRP